MNSFYKWKTILVTGSTGFKWSWLSLWLQSIWANVIGYGLHPNSQPNLFGEFLLEEKITQYYGDICDKILLNDIIQKEQPEIIFHLAAQPLVRESYANPLETMQTNVMWTTHILELIKEYDCVKGAVMITTDKVYENNERIYPYREIDRLWGHDPYSTSKAMCELVIESYKKSFRPDYTKKIATMRAWNVIGWWDWSADRLIPDIIRSIYDQKELVLRNPYSVRPRQHVLEAIHAYIIIWQKIFENNTYCSAYNIWPSAADNMQVLDIVNKSIELLWEWSFTIDYETNKGMHEAWLLLLDTSKIQQDLWRKPKYDVTQTIQKTFDRYKSYYTKKKDIVKLSLEEIALYK